VSWHTHEAASGFRQFDYVENDAFVGGCVRGSMTGKALVDIGQVNYIASCMLNVSSKPRNCLAISHVSGCYVQNQQVPERVDSKGIELVANLFRVRNDVFQPF
jgi:hypothetical protein